MIKLSLPWPPTINHAYVISDNRPRPKGEMVTFKRNVWLSAEEQYKGPGLGKARLEVHIQAFPPDNRKRDLDNIQKVLLDALQDAGLFEDDGQIDYLSILRGPKFSGGLIQVQIAEKSNGNQDGEKKDE